MVQQTSLMAFQGLVEPMVGKRQHEVYIALARRGPSTNMELALYLGWSINCVTPRMIELRTMGWVVDNGVRLCSVTHHNSHEWRAR